MNQQGWYTVVISDDVARPDWLPVPIAWMPWGDEQFQKWSFNRHMIPVESEADYDSADLFQYAIQKVVAGCWRGQNDADPVQGKLRCNHPVAVWCDKYAFEHAGWRACLRD